MELFWLPLRVIWILQGKTTVSLYGAPGDIKNEERKILRASTSRVLTPRLGLEVSGIWHEMIYDLDD